MIIDAHSHYMPPEVAQKTAFFKVNWSDIDRQLAVMDQNKIEKALLLYPTSDAHLNMGGWQDLCYVYNKEIAAVVQKHKGRFIGGGIIPVDAPAQFSAELKRIQDLGLHVISLASSYEGKYLDDDIFAPVYEFAQKNKMLIHVHPQIMSPIGEDRVRDPLLTPVLEYVFDVSVCIGKMMMSGTFLKFPDVKFIFAHYGGVLPLVKERFDTTYSMLRRRPVGSLREEFVRDLSKLPSEYFKNLYFDTSGSKSPASLACALEVTDAAHILFGSDFPANQGVVEAIACVHGSTISEENKRLILHNDLLKRL
ncbi:MAG: amidohydrolase [Candidatus Omnitrophica bacterium]|nr:amidohydrolase [Candidatus Omnitrophota bacterium]